MKTGNHRFKLLLFCQNHGTERRSDTIRKQIQAICKRTQNVQIVLWQKMWGGIHRKERIPTKYYRNSPGSKNAWGDYILSKGQIHTSKRVCLLDSGTEIDTLSSKINTRYLTTSIITAGKNVKIRLISASLGSRIKDGDYAYEDQIYTLKEKLELQCDHPTLVLGTAEGGTDELLKTMEHLNFDSVFIKSATLSRTFKMPDFCFMDSRLGIAAVKNYWGDGEYFTALTFGRRNPEQQINTSLIDSPISPCHPSSPISPCYPSQPGNTCNTNSNSTNNDSTNNDSNTCNNTTNNDSDIISGLDSSVITCSFEPSCAEEPNPGCLGKGTIGVKTIHLQENNGRCEYRFHLTNGRVQLQKVVNGCWGTVNEWC